MDRTQEPVYPPSRACTEIVVERDAWFHGFIRTPIRAEEGIVLCDNGTDEQPSIRFESNPGTGLRTNDGNDLVFVVDSVPQMRIAGTGLQFNGSISAGVGDTTLNSPTAAISVSGKVIKNVSDILGPNGTSLLGEVAAGGNTTVQLAGAGTGTVTIGTFTATTERMLHLVITALCGNSSSAASHVCRFNVRWAAGGGSTVTNLINQRNADAGLETSVISLAVTGRTVTIRGTSSLSVQWQGRLTFTQLFL